MSGACVPVCSPTSCAWPSAEYVSQTVPASSTTYRLCPKPHAGRLISALTGCSGTRLALAPIVAGTSTRYTFHQSLRSLTT